MKIIIPISLLLSASLGATPIVHEFKNPSFSGKGTGAHYLTIENQEHSRKKAIEEGVGQRQRSDIIHAAFLVDQRINEE